MTKPNLNGSLMHELQQLMHKHGVEEFALNLGQAFYYASEEMETINPKASEHYQSLGSLIQDYEFIDQAATAFANQKARAAIAKAEGRGNG